MQDFLAFRRIDLVDFLHDLHRFGGTVSLLPGVDFNLGFDSMFGKKLLRFDTGISATAMVAPVEFFHFGIFFVEIGFDWVGMPTNKFESRLEKACLANFSGDNLVSQDCVFDSLLDFQNFGRFRATYPVQRQFHGRY